MTETVPVEKIDPLIEATKEGLLLRIEYDLAVKAGFTDLTPEEWLEIRLSE